MPSLLLLCVALSLESISAFQILSSGKESTRLRLVEIFYKVLSDRHLQMSKQWFF